MNLPPKLLRRHVGGQVEDDEFLLIGRRCVESIQAVAPEGPFAQALDFGCGCGRMLRHLIPRFAPARWFACDPELAAVRWVADNMPKATAFVIEPLGGIPLPDASVDLVVAVSIFSHAPEWSRPMMELRRVMRPGGILIFTYLGRHCYDRRGLSTPYEALTEAYVEPTPIPCNPDWTRFYPPAGWAVAETSRFFTVLSEHPHGLAGFQDIIVAEVP